MDGAREQALAGAGLAEDQQRRVRLRDARGEVEDALHLRARADHALQREALAHRDLEVVGARTKARLVERATEEEIELVELEGLREVVVRAAPDRLDGGVDRAVRRHDDDGPLRRDLARRRDELEAVDVRHAQVRDDGVERLAQLRERLGARRRGRHFVAAIGETLRDHAAHVAIVIDNENAFHAALSFAGVLVAGNSSRASVPPLARGPMTKRPW